ncbi:MAG: 3-hydroxybutyrate dehydrogenase [Chlamydiae bacterium]|nr:3-hydroxybutyrate dehydrogenase [Chlamydiota bacterium]
MKNKIILVTGSASGIGKSIAEKFCKEGSIVYVTDLDEQRAQATSHEFHQLGWQSFALGMDVSNEDQVNRAVDIITVKHGCIDVVVCNAGIQHISPIDQLAFKDWKKMLAVHLDGAFLITKACLIPMYKRNQGGAILYIGSVHSKEASRLKAPYVTAKHGLEGLCQVVAKEGALYGVRSNLICPGFVRTPLVDKQIPEQAVTLGISEERVIKEVMLKDTVDGEFTTAEDIAEVTYFFANFNTNALTGQSIVVSHGWCMQ